MAKMKTGPYTPQPVGKPKVVRKPLKTRPKSMLGRMLGKQINDMTPAQKKAAVHSLKPKQRARLYAHRKKNVNV